LPKSLAKACDNYLAKKAVWKTSFSNKPSGTIDPAYLPPELLNTIKNMSVNKKLSITTLDNYFILQFWRKIASTTMTSIAFCFGNHEMIEMERNASNLLQDLERDEIEGHLLELTSESYMKEHLMNNHDRTGHM